MLRRKQFDPTAVDELHAVEASKTQAATVLVLGFTGASGRSTTVKELAYCYSVSGGVTWGIDADLVSPTLSHELLSHIDKDLVDYIRACSSADLVSPTIARFDKAEIGVVSGLRKSHRWIDVTTEGFAALIRQAEQRCDHVVIDVCTGIESVNLQPSRSADVKNIQLQSDTTTRLRDARQLAHLALGYSDTILITTRPDDMSLSRLVDGVSRRQSLFADKRLHVVVTQVLNDREESEARRTIQRLLGCSSMTFIPHDPELARRAIREKVPICVLKPRSAVADAYRGLVEELQSNKESTLVTTRMTSVLRRAS